MGPLGRGVGLPIRDHRVRRTHRSRRGASHCCSTHSGELLASPRAGSGLVRSFVGVREHVLSLLRLPPSQGLEERRQAFTGLLQSDLLVPLKVGGEAEALCS